MIHYKNIGYISLSFIIGYILFPVQQSLALEIVDKTVFKIDLAKYDIKVRASPIGYSSTVRYETAKIGGEAGINASFFCPKESAYKRCGADNSTSSERILGGNNISKYPDDTGVRGIFGFTDIGEPLLVQNNLGFIAGYTRNSNAHRIGDIVDGIGNRPILIDHGSNATYSYGDYINDPKFTSKSRRGFICSTEDNKTIYMGFVPTIALKDLAVFIQNKYNCFNAINLDAGGSSALVYRNQHLVGPGRQVVDGFVAVPKPRRIQEMLDNYQRTPKDQVLYDALLVAFTKRMTQRGNIWSQKVLGGLQSLERSTSMQANIPRRIVLKKLIDTLSVIQQ